MVKPLPAPGWLVTIAQFTAWLVTSLVAVVDMLFIRYAALAVMQALQIIDYNELHKRGFMGINYQFGFAIGAADNIILVVLSVCAVAFTVWVEYYFRRGRPLGLLWKRIGIVLACQIGIVILSILIQVISGV
jgi:hypothetical protein